MKIFIGNLDYQVSEDELRQEFEVFGDVASVSIVTDRDSGRPRGFAFVEMANKSEAKTAIDGLNDLGATSVADTINIIIGARQPQYAPARWMRILFDGQAGNTKCTVSWWVLFRKSEGFIGSKGDQSWYGVMDKL